MTRSVIVNLTDHNPITLVLESGAEVVLPSAGCVRLKETPETVGHIELDEGAIPLVIQHYGEAEGLPEQRPGTWLVVSQLTAEALPERSDLLFPAVYKRDESGSGTIVGCRALGRVGA